MCPICNTHLIPIVYGFVGEKYLDAHRKGLIFLVRKHFIPNKTLYLIALYAKNALI